MRWKVFRIWATFRFQTIEVQSLGDISLFCYVYMQVARHIRPKGHFKDGLQYFFFLLAAVAIIYYRAETGLPL